MEEILKAIEYVNSVSDRGHFSVYINYRISGFDFTHFSDKHNVVRTISTYFDGTRIDSKFKRHDTVHLENLLSCIRDYVESLERKE